MLRTLNTNVAVVLGLDIFPDNDYNDDDDVNDFMPGNCHPDSNNHKELLERSVLKKLKEKICICQGKSLSL